MTQVATQPEIFIILNPNAAKGRALRQRDVIESFFYVCPAPLFVGTLYEPA